MDITGVFIELKINKFIIHNFSKTFAESIVLCYNRKMTVSMSVSRRNCNK